VILTLVRELRRSQTLFARGALVLVLFAVELASFTMVSASTRVAEQARADQAQGTDREHTAVVGTWTNGTGTRINLGNDIGGPEELATVSADIRAADPRSVSVQIITASIVGLSGRHVFRAVDPLSPLALAEGRAPGVGEVAISAEIATGLGIGVGGALSLEAARDVPGADLTLTVTGILRTPSSDAVESNIESAVISAQDAGALADSTETIADVNAEGAVTTGLMSILRWDGAVPASVVPYTGGEWGTYPGGGNEGFRLKGAQEMLTTSLAVLFAISALVAAGLAARNQVQARSRWAETVRELGAKRRHVVAAALIEGLIMGGVVAVVGGVMGWATNAMLLAHATTNNPTTFLPSTAPYPAWALGATLLLGVVLAVPLSFVPGCWVARQSTTNTLPDARDSTNRPDGTEETL
jgi:hypothetical protein